MISPTTLPHQHQTTPGSGLFWRDRSAWKRAAANTFTCLVGCSIGDLGALIYIQVFYPGTPLLLTMAIAMTSGLATSILLETTILRLREGFSWRRAVQVAFSMSFISMLGMEFATNATDFFLTGGLKIGPGEAWFWGALAISLVVGFLTPLPYNYYALKKHGKTCHGA
ncbi:MAG: DUF4396 domain-containing protein [Planctomycetes bacterium]|nr:DUF4396 domain-containing protein [Planctomycetota bacterium]